MARLPTPGSDTNQWGDILNEFLKAEHNPDGSQKTLDISKGGTGATTPAAARINLGLGNVDNTSDATKPVSTPQQTAITGVSSALTAHAALESGEAHPVRTVPAPVVTNFTVTAVAGGGTLPAGWRYYGCSAILPGGAPTNFVYVERQSSSIGRFELACDPFSGAIGYRWYEFSTTAGVYWDTTLPAFTDDGSNPGTVADGPDDYYTPKGAVPYMVVTSAADTDWTLPASSGHIWAPFDNGYTSNSDRFEFLQADPGNPLVHYQPAHVHIKKPGVYLVTLAAVGPDATSWDDLTFNIFGTETGGGSHLMENYHAGHFPAIPGMLDGGAQTEMIISKVFVTMLDDPDFWRFGVRVNNRNTDGSRTIQSLRMNVITLVR